MSYFISPTPLNTRDVCTLSGDEAKHLLLARRVKIGETVEVQDPNYDRFLCRITHIDKKGVALEVLSPVTTPPEPAVLVTVYQALIAQQALDIIIQKSTELGVQTLAVFQADYSPATLRPEKLERWQRISLEAAKQCGRSKPITITTATLPDILKSIQTPCFYLSQHAAKSLTNLLPNHTEHCSLLIGPEGGWSKQEEQAFAGQPITPALLAGFVLRAETAAISAVTLVVNRFR